MLSKDESPGEKSSAGQRSSEAHGANSAGHQIEVAGKHLPQLREPRRSMVDRHRTRRTSRRSRGAKCVQRSTDSRNSAHHGAYRSSLRPS